MHNNIKPSYIDVITKCLYRHIFVDFFISRLLTEASTLETTSVSGCTTTTVTSSLTSVSTHRLIRQRLSRWLRACMCVCLLGVCWLCLTCGSSLHSSTSLNTTCVSLTVALMIWVRRSRGGWRRTCTRRWTGESSDIVPGTVRLPSLTPWNHHMVPARNGHQRFLVPVYGNKQYQRYQNFLVVPLVCGFLGNTVHRQ